MVSNFEKRQCELLVDFLNDTCCMIPTPYATFAIKYRKILPNKKYSPDWVRRINVEVLGLYFPRFPHATKNYFNSQVRFHTERTINKYLKDFGFKLIDRHLDIRVVKVYWKDK